MKRKNIALHAKIEDAVVKGDFEMINKNTKGLSAYNASGLSVFQSVAASVATGDVKLDVLRGFYNKYDTYISVDEVDGENNNVLHYAYKEKNQPLVEWLVSIGVSQVQKNNIDQTPKESGEIINVPVIAESSKSVVVQGCGGKSIVIPKLCIEIEEDMVKVSAVEYPLDDAEEDKSQGIINSCVGKLLDTVTAMTGHCCFASVRT